MDEEKRTFEKAVSSEAAANTTKNADYISRTPRCGVFDIVEVKMKSMLQRVITLSYPICTIAVFIPESRP
ncbi:hypothetical protein F2P45_13275 [Massilia sp. CCM 8733]|uniref:Uncharacterized protein n=1 Tax=Massilia mucilaginosa TaxID=2609282 RepID=A0ABX0NT04_9BURK|nr:hypothetical protein [Massilia mucilaginosa]NHZ89977.1 hypothetical protein [Massilia mucilaginosa]